MCFCVCKVNFSFESFHLDNNEIVKLCGKYWIISVAEIDLLRIQHDKHLPCFTVSRDPTIIGASILAVVHSISHLLWRVKYDVIHSLMCIKQKIEHLQSISLLFCRKLLFSFFKETLRDVHALLHELFAKQRDLL